KSTCKNCRKKGHVQDQCWEEGGGKAGQVPKWFQNKGKGKKKEKGSGKVATAASISASLNAYMNTFDHGLLAGESLNSTKETILFDSGMSCHMSSYCSKFLDYKPIIPKPI
ncbi:hypothetical protein M404DRAFT_73262, partial [Pisolithus tinctorius Marx 270]